MTAQQYQSWYEGRIAGKGWRHIAHLSGGGQLNDSGSHMVDILLHVTGLLPVSVSAVQQNLGLEVDVNMGFNVRFAGGALGSIAILGQAPGIGGTVYEDVTITGDTRSFEAEVQQLLERRIRQVSEGVAAAHGASVEVTYTHEFAPTVNDADVTAVAVRAASRALGEHAVDGVAAPIMASEDFGVLAEHVPACLALLGNGTEPGRAGTPLHSHDYRFNDDVLASGIAYYRAVVRDSLAGS